MVSQSILWYDLETWGHRVFSTRIAQFAAVRTDFELNPIDEPIVYYSPPSPDYIPNPAAVLVHRLLPNQLPAEHTLTELDLLKKIRDQVARPGTVVAGYNNCRFDNLVLRFSWYRNALEPYTLDFGEGKVWDIIDLVRTCFALYPKNFQWRRIKEKSDFFYTSFKLEHLNEDNSLSHGEAHDALSDVRATIALAKKIKTEKPKLYHYLFELRAKSTLVERFRLSRLELSKAPLLVHISGMLPDSQRRSEVMMPIEFHPRNANELICVGLKQSPKTWMEESVDAIRDRVFKPQKELDLIGQERIRLFTIHLKHVPVLMPIAALKNTDSWAQIDHDPEQCKQNHAWVIAHHEEVQKKLKNVFATSPPIADKEKDVDLSLYDLGFISRSDKNCLELFHQKQSNWALDNEQQLCFEQPARETICFRTRARNAPDTLSPAEQERWMNFCQMNYQDGLANEYSLPECQSDLAALESQSSLDTKDRTLLEHYAQWLKINRTLSTV